MPLNAAELQVSLAGPEVGPLRVRLANASRDAIRSGRPGPGTTLPSTRILAQDLGLSHGVVVDAYNQLAAEGFIRGRPRRGHDGGLGAGGGVAGTVAEPATAEPSRSGAGSPAGLAGPVGLPASNLGACGLAYSPG